MRPLSTLPRILIAGGLFLLVLQWLLRKRTRARNLNDHVPDRLTPEQVAMAKSANSTQRNNTLVLICGAFEQRFWAEAGRKDANQAP